MAASTSEKKPTSTGAPVVVDVKFNNDTHKVPNVLPDATTVHDIIFVVSWELRVLPLMVHLKLTPATGGATRTFKLTDAGPSPLLAEVCPSLSEACINATVAPMDQDACSDASDVLLLRLPYALSPLTGRLEILPTADAHPATLCAATNARVGGADNKLQLQCSHVVSAAAWGERGLDRCPICREPAVVVDPHGGSSTRSTATCGTLADEAAATKCCSDPRCHHPGRYLLADGRAICDEHYGKLDGATKNMICAVGMDEPFWRFFHCEMHPSELVTHVNVLSGKCVCGGCANDAKSDTIEIGGDSWRHMFGAKYTAIEATLRGGLRTLRRALDMCNDEVARGRQLKSEMSEFVADYRRRAHETVDAMCDRANDESTQIYDTYIQRHLDRAHEAERGIEAIAQERHRLLCHSAHLVPAGGCSLADSLCAAVDRHSDQAPLPLSASRAIADFDATQRRNMKLAKAAEPFLCQLSKLDFIPFHIRFRPVEGILRSLVVRRGTAVARPAKVISLKLGDGQPEVDCDMDLFGPEIEMDHPFSTVEVGADAE